MTAAHRITRAWISAGGTGAQNYDEFADDQEITAVIERNPGSALAIEMPHKAPVAAAAGASFEQELPAATRRLRAAQAEGAYHPQEGVVAAYRITAPDGVVSLGLFAMVDTQEISTSAAEPGRVIRNEDVFIAKVRQRVALIHACDHLLSAVLLVQTESAVEFAALLGEVCASGGAPDVVDYDSAGRTHEVWVVAEPALVETLCALAGSGEMVVADGNHRSLAAQRAGLDRFLAVITTAPALSLLPYHRLLAPWDADLGGIDDVLRSAGAAIEPLSVPLHTPQRSGVVHIYSAGQGYAVHFPAAQRADEEASMDRVQSMDHAMVERHLLGRGLGWQPDDARITYVGGDYSARWLCAAVDAGRAAAAVLIAPVSVDDFVAVNMNRSAMPRKSTWFVPKARAGLVLADLR